MFYVYVIKSENGEKYYGFTSDIVRRLEMHNAGETFSTKGKKWEIVYYEAYKDAMDARERERMLKHHGNSKRMLLSRIKRSLIK